MKKAKFILPPSKLEIFINIWRFFVYYVYLGILAIGFFMAIKNQEEKRMLIK
ncbi:hypothetical protein VTU32_08315 [Thermoanaerobacter sp. CM-CNRG TB177]|jgi:hypothetical protein|uniref:Uncharacterized protein n=2 Tax=Thermoanaerobacter TaxID=1754 RepID=B0K751_THEP3|nr:hypothetical protein Teth514_1017 [Thermoanaerobacter sp. X514]ABY94198.1 hypothetical protein Teth39_0533 [Thermoanaerobacter pseudethanolicus ATCC 33223]ADV79151.1 hypothetical protein Thebr_0548 [Thermoanaerobacter brockii subsp. finnii Ako-1]MDI3501234.1 hypothetical protein [Thermoanaerobacter sp.]